MNRCFSATFTNWSRSYRTRSVQQRGRMLLWTPTPWSIS